MMLHPSYSDLMEVVNAEAEEAGEAPVVKSRYSIVMATAKRAKQIIERRNEERKKEEKMHSGDDKYRSAYDESGHELKPLTIAVKELKDGKIRILGDEE